MLAGGGGEGVLMDSITNHYVPVSKTVLAHWRELGESPLRLLHKNGSGATPQASLSYETEDPCTNLTEQPWQRVLPPSLSW